MQRDTHVVVRLSQSENTRLAELQTALGCNRSEAFRVLLRGVDAEGKHGNRMLPSSNRNGERAKFSQDAGATPLVQS
jgi:hypothetical protein